MSEEFQADPAHVERSAGWVDGERYKVAVVRVLSDRVENGMAHGWH